MYDILCFEYYSLSAIVYYQVVRDHLMLSSVRVVIITFLNTVIADLVVLFISVVLSVTTVSIPDLLIFEFLQYLSL